MNADDEQDILAFHDDRLATAPGIGRIIPAPVYFQDKREYLSSWAGASSLDGQKDLETELISFCSFWLSRFEDDPETPQHSPLATLTYEIYLFSEYSVERFDEDQSDQADLERRMIKRQRDFVGALLGIKEAYQGNVNVGLDPSTWAKAFSEPARMTAAVDNQATCRYVPGVIGIQAILEVDVRLRTKEC